MIAIRTHAGDVIEVEPDGPLSPEDLASLVGEAPDPLVMALVKEIRRLSDRLVALTNQPPVINVSPAAVNVSPAISAPAVNVSPQVAVNAPTDWYAIPEYHSYGPFQGKIKQVRFLAAQP